MKTVEISFSAGMKLGLSLAYSFNNLWHCGTVLLKVSVCFGKVNFEHIFVVLICVDWEICVLNLSFTHFTAKLSNLCSLL